MSGLFMFSGLREMIANARNEGYESITLTDLEHAIDLAEEHGWPTITTSPIGALMDSTIEDD